jgi:hypothetical protein
MNTNNIAGFLLLPLGIICGIAVTFLLKSFQSQQLTHLKLEANLPVAASQVIRKNDLLDEKKKLLSRLKEIAVLIQQADLLSNPNASIKEPIVDKVEQVSHIQSPNRNLSEISKCKYGFKVYVYPIPFSISSIRISEEARKNKTLHVCQKCILEQFASEYIFYDFFSQFCGRTYNPYEADYFYLPIVRDAEYRVAMELKLPKARAPSITEQAILNILEKNDSSLWKSAFGITDSFWHRYQGADHIIVMPAPVTNFRHESSRRGFFHYMSHLHRPIFLGVEYSIQFAKEYPICSTKKNIVVPYPTTDPDLFNGHLLTPKIKRTSLLYYAGGLHGDCIEIRRAMQILMRNSSALPNVIPKVRPGQTEREHGFLASMFCPVPIGDSPSSKRMYDVLNFGCIPVILSDDLVWAFSDQSGGPLNHSDFAIQMPQSVIQYTSQRTLRLYQNRKREFGILPSGILLYDLLAKSHAIGGDYTNGIYVNPLVQILKLIPKQDIEHFQNHGNKAANFYRYYAMNKSMNSIPTAHHILPDGGAMEIVSNALQDRKTYGLAKLGDECQIERKRPKHTYQHRYTCDVEKEEALIRRRKLEIESLHVN